MNTKGFTLIELIAIIVILSAIFLVSFPVLINTAKSDKEKKYNNMVNDLCLAGESYIYANMDDYPKLSTIGSKISISVSNLMDYGNVDKSLKDPNTNQTVKNNRLEYTVLSDYSLDCVYKY